MTAFTDFSRTLLRPERVAQGLTVLLLCVWVAYVSDGVLQALAPAKLPVPPQTQIAQLDTASAAPSPAWRGLFGGVVGQVAGNVQIKGVVAVASQDGAGAAILVVDGKPAEVVQTGQTLGNVKLVAVSREAIVVERNGVREELRVPAAPSTPAGSVANKTAPTPSNALDGAPTPQPLNPTPPAQSNAANVPAQATAVGTSAKPTSGTAGNPMVPLGGDLPPKNLR